MSSKFEEPDEIDRLGNLRDFQTRLNYCISKVCETEEVEYQYLDPFATKFLYDICLYDEYNLTYESFREWAATQLKSVSYRKYTKQSFHRHIKEKLETILLVVSPKGTQVKFKTIKHLVLNLFEYVQSLESRQSYGIDKVAYVTAFRLTSADNQPQETVFGGINNESQFKDLKQDALYLRREVEGLKSIFPTSYIDLIIAFLDKFLNIFDTK